MNIHKIRQTDKKTHRQSSDRDCDSERVLDQEKERERGRERDKEGQGGRTETEIVRKTSRNDVHINKINILHKKNYINKPWHFMPFQKYRVWQVHLNDPTVFVK